MHLKYELEESTRKIRDSPEIVGNSQSEQSIMTIFGKLLTVFSKLCEEPSELISCSLFQKEGSLGRDLDPGPLPYQGNALPG